MAETIFIKPDDRAKPGAAATPLRRPTNDEYAKGGFAQAQ